MSQSSPETLYCRSSLAARHASSPPLGPQQRNSGWEAFRRCLRRGRLLCGATTYCEKWSSGVEMCLFLEDLREGSCILCLCSRAFVEDRKLCSLGLKGYYVKDDGNSAGEQATEEEEGGRPQGTAESRDSKDVGPDESELDSEAELMRSMGLPLQCGRVSAHKNFEVSMNTRNKV